MKAPNWEGRNLSIGSLHFVLANSSLQMLPLSAPRHPERECRVKQDVESHHPSARESAAKCLLLPSGVSDELLETLVSRKLETRKSKSRLAKRMLKFKKECVFLSDSDVISNTAFKSTLWVFNIVTVAYQFIYKTQASPLSRGWIWELQAVPLCPSAEHWALPKHCACSKGADFPISAIKWEKCIAQIHFWCTKASKIKSGYFQSNFSFAA